MCERACTTHIAKNPQAGGVLGETMHWHNTAQPGLRGTMTSYLGSELFQRIESVEMAVADQYVWQGVADRRAVMCGHPDCDSFLGISPVS